MGYQYTPTSFMLPTSHYDKTKADRAVAFVRNLRHTKGKWAGKPFTLLPWQEQIVRDLFGVVKADGKRQFRSPKRTGNDDAALVGRDAASGILIHQKPEADRTGALIARLIVDDNGTGIADVGVWHRPGLNVDGLTPFREPVDLHPVPGHRPEQPVAFQRVRKLVAVPPRDLLREI